MVALLPLIKLFLPHLNIDSAPDEKNPGHACCLKCLKSIFIFLAKVQVHFLTQQSE